jgi:hypothetical protein
MLAYVRMLFDLSQKNTRIAQLGILRALFFRFFAPFTDYTYFLSYSLIIIFIVLEHNVKYLITYYTIIKNKGLNNNKIDNSGN